MGRSLRLYYGDAERTRRMDRLLARFVRPGDLVLDLGAHVGDRVASCRRLGARVVALEPQPGPLRALHVIHGRDPGVAIDGRAVGARPGWATLLVNARNPTVSTASSAFAAAARDAPSWEGERWDGRVEVAVTTLDELIARHGRPAFVKIDVEGWEDRVLAGLGAPVPALSFEVTTLRREVALACVEALDRLAAHEFNLSLGERHRLALPRWTSAERMARLLLRLPQRANSGDVYARPARR